MKPLFLFLLFSVNFFLAPAQTLYKIDVNISEGPASGKAFLSYWGSKGPYLDSAVIRNGRFTISGNFPGELTIAKLRVTEKENANVSFENSCKVWLEPGQINITAEKKLVNARFGGSLMQEQFTVLEQSLKETKKKENLLNDIYNRAEAEKDSQRKDKLLNEEYPAVFLEKQKILGTFIKKNPASLISACMFEEFAGEGQIDLSVVEPVYNQLHDSIKQNPKVKKVAGLMEITRRTSPGKEAIDFSQADTSGIMLSLSTFRGKYLLIDFWAGWCMPCRAENPHLRQLYGKYNSKGFEILGVSLDGERKRWTEAIREDKLIWPQVSDLEIFDNAVAKLYGITSIPQNILIGPDSRIIAWNLRGSVLDKKIEELLK